MPGSYTYAYAAPSAFTAPEALVLSTSGGSARPVATAPAAAGAAAPTVAPTAAPTAAPDTPSAPRFFAGFAARPGVAAAGMLAVAQVARARYVDPRDVTTRDPVITSDGSMLRLESFSDCCGVYARLDLLPEMLDGVLAARGTTNVDVGEPLRRALARTGDGGLLHLTVGRDELAVTTADGGTVERRVPLPRRWVRGFAEVQVLSTALEPQFELDAAGAAGFLGGLGSGARASGAGWVVPSGAGVRATSGARPGAVCLPGPARLAALRPLLRHATGLRVHGPAVRAGSPPVVSAWELQLPGARLVLTLSPEVRRGFSGEGAVLSGLVAPGVEDDAVTVLALLEDLPGIDLDRVARRTGLGTAQVRAALTYLGVSGRVGYDVATARHFARELPFLASAADRDNPRLAAARALVAGDAVRRVPDPDGTDDVVEVEHDGRRHRVRAHDGRLRCTCPWYAAYGGSRGPCSHVLAVQLVEGRA